MGSRIDLQRGIEEIGADWISRTLVHVEADARMTKYEDAEGKPQSRLSLVQRMFYLSSIGCEELDTNCEQVLLRFSADPPLRPSRSSPELTTVGNSIEEGYPVLSSEWSSVLYLISLCNSTRAFWISTTLGFICLCV